jgi:hypothetical protein
VSSAQRIVSSRVVIRRESAIRSRISRGQRQLAGTNGITVSYALVARSGQGNLLRAPGPQIVHEGSEEFEESEIMEVRRCPLPS